VPKARVRPQINQPIAGAVGASAVTVGGGGGGGTSPLTVTLTSTNAITSATHTHQLNLGDMRAASFVTLAAHDDLTAERVLTAGNGLSLTDGGSGGAVTLAIKRPTPSGLALDAAGLALADEVAGAGLAISGKVLSIDLLADSGLVLTDKLALRTPVAPLSSTSTDAVSDAAGHSHSITAYSDLDAYPGHLAKADAYGHSKWTSLEVKADGGWISTSRIESVAEMGMVIAPSLNLALSPATYRVSVTEDVAIDSDNYASQLTGWRISYAGGADFRSLYSDELHAKTFITDLEQALAGQQIITKSVAVVAQDFTVPAAEASAYLYVEDLPGAPDVAVFQSGDIVRLRRFTRTLGSLTTANAWGVVSDYTDQAGGMQRWTWTRSAAPYAGSAAAGSTIYAKTLALDYGTSGSGYYQVHAAEGAWGENSPYAQIVTWTTHPLSSSVIRTLMGNLRGVFAVPNEYGLYAGDGTTDASSYLRISNEAVEAHNLPIKLYDGADVAIALTPSASPSIAMGVPVPTGWLTQSGWWAGKHTDGTYRQYVGQVTGWPFDPELVKGFSWDGTTFAVKGEITATTGAIGGFTIGADTLSATNLALKAGAANIANITVGTGATAGGLGSPAAAGDIAMWAGSSFADRAAAPFRVTANGELYAGWENAVLSKAGLLVVADIEDAGLSRAEVTFKIRGLDDTVYSLGGIYGDWGGDAGGTAVVSIEAWRFDDDPGPTSPWGKTAVRLAAYDEVLDHAVTLTVDGMANAVALSPNVVIPYGNLDIGYLNLTTGYSAPAGYPLGVQGNRAGDYVGFFRNWGNNANRHVLKLQGGADNASGTTYFLGLFDGDGTWIGALKSIDGSVQIESSPQQQDMSGVKPSAGMLAKLRQVQVVDYTYRGGDTRHTGFVPEALAKVFPEVVTYDEEHDHYGTALTNMIPIQAAALLELDATVTALQKRVTQLEGRTA